MRTMKLSRKRESHHATRRIDQHPTASIHGYQAIILCKEQQMLQKGISISQILNSPPIVSTFIH